MGSGQSVRKTDFQHPSPKAANMEEDASEDHHINISNKMVERLVEDAALIGNSSSSVAALKEDIEKMYIDKLRSLDDNHSEKCGLMVEEMKSLIERVEKRTAHVMNMDPVCEEYKKNLIDCYSNSPENVVRCWNIVGAFTACVQAAGRQRLRAHTDHEDFEREKRDRRVARARQNALKDLGAPINAQ